MEMPGTWNEKMVASFSDRVQLRALHGAVQVEPEIVFHQMNESLDLVRIFRLNEQRLEHIHGLFRFQERKVVPALQLDVDPGGNLQHLA